MVRRLSRTPALLLLSICAIILLACDLSFNTASITNAVMAKDAKGDNYEPVGVTDMYSADQGKFHAIVSIATAPSDTKVKAVWTAVDVGSAAPPNTRIDQAEVKAEGTRNIDFTLAPDGAVWPPGNYQVEIYLDGKLDRTLKFAVATPPPPPTRTPSPPTRTPAPPTKVPASPTVPVAQKCPPLPPTTFAPSSAVGAVTMALGAQGNTKEPVNPTTVFPPNAVFHAVVSTQNAPANTNFSATWYATDIGFPDCNVIIDTTELTTDGTRNIDFTLAPKTVWPEGIYRVEIGVNGTPERFVSFTVGSKSVPTVAPTSTSQASSSGRPPIPAGQGGLAVVSHYGREVNFTINKKLYKIPPNGTEYIFLAPGKYTYSANIPGVGSANDEIEIQQGAWFTQTFSD